MIFDLCTVRVGRPPQAQRAGRFCTPHTEAVPGAERRQCPQVGPHLTGQRCKVDPWARVIWEGCDLTRVRGERRKKEREKTKTNHLIAQWELSPTPFLLVLPVLSCLGLPVVRSAERRTIAPPPRIAEPAAALHVDDAPRREQRVGDNHRHREPA